jgi:hypothetical protein
VRVVLVATLGVVAGPVAQAQRRRLRF